jgi:hypothetical protein
MNASRCDSCHGGQYPSFGTFGAVGVVSNHIPLTITAGLDCNTCHTTASVPPPIVPATAGADAWQSEIMNHNGAQGGGSPIYCVTCHLKGMAYLAPKTLKTKSHNGSSTAKDCSSTGCHIPIGKKGVAYSSWTN